MTKKTMNETNAAIRAATNAWREGDLSAMVGKVMIAVRVGAARETLRSVASDGISYEFMHHHDCCETVEIVDICGDLMDLVGTPLLLAEQRVSEDVTPKDVGVPEDADMDESFTWTFYEFATIRGSVSVRWLGTSNGYYSEAVSLRVNG